MTPLEELHAEIAGPARAVVLSEKDLDLRDLSGGNRVFVLRMVEGSHAAGGRGAGFGERRVTRVSLYSLGGGSCSLDFRTEAPEGLSLFEVPYHVSRLPFTMADGSEQVGYGAVDPELVADYAARAESSGRPQKGSGDPQG